MLGYITCKLSDFDLFFEITFEAGIDDLSLARFKAINDGGD